MTTEVTITIDKELLEQFSAVCAELGLTAEEVCVAFFEAVVRDESILEKLIEAEERNAELSDEVVEKIVAQCVANQLLEGQICDEEDIEAVRRIVRGETTAMDEVREVLAKYSPLSKSHPARNAMKEDGE